MTVLCPGRSAGPDQLSAVQALFATVGRVALVEDEDLMSVVTALSGSGPAYTFIILEALSEGGVKMGLPRALATELAAQALLGGAALALESGQHPALLKADVTTPAGVTIDGLLALEEGGVRVSLIKAVIAATERSAQLASLLDRDASRPT
jgi:pyrroline-5-carboxylate reductase